MQQKSLMLDDVSDCEDAFPPEYMWERSYREEIVNSNVAEDYELDDEDISYLNRAFNIYYFDHNESLGLRNKELNRQAHNFSKDVDKLVNSMEKLNQSPAGGKWLLGAVFGNDVFDPQKADELLENSIDLLGELKRIKTNIQANQQNLQSHPKGPQENPYFPQLVAKLAQFWEEKYLQNTLEIEVPWAMNTQKSEQIYAAKSTVFQTAEENQIKAAKSEIYDLIQKTLEIMGETVDIKTLRNIYPAKKFRSC